MPPWRIRDFQSDDLDGVLRLWDDPAAGDAEPVFGLAELVSAVRNGEPTVVATVGDAVVGCALAEVDHDRAWVLRISLSPQWRRRGMGSALLSTLEQRLLSVGVHRISCLLSSLDATGSEALRHQGYRARGGVMWEKVEAASISERVLLDQLGGRHVRPDLWDSLKGMVGEKHLIERRIVRPLAEPELARRTGLELPRAVILFGPPGTGKTTFAKAVASRLGWPFVELFPSRMAGESPAGLAGALRDTFSQIAELSSAVVFIDEVEEIAAVRQSGAPAAANGVTNEMLKLIPAFREQEGKVLICATNSVRSLDPAFLRHGRFDYVIPIGPPDPEARRAIWERYLAEVPHEGVDDDLIVARSELLTPADIEFAARKVAQRLFDRAVAGEADPQVRTADVLESIAALRPTLSAVTVAEFEADIDDFARL